jgi:hypothetical protein
MNTKLTLRLDQGLVRRAKAHSKRTGKSVSKIVADYFAVLETSVESEDMDITPLVRSLKGVLRCGKVEQKDYKRHLAEKYL